MCYEQCNEIGMKILWHMGIRCPTGCCFILNTFPLLDHQNKLRAILKNSEFLALVLPPSDLVLNNLMTLC